MTHGELAVGLLSTVALGLAGWALQKVVALAEALAEVKAVVGNETTGALSVLAKLDRTVEGLSGVVSNLDKHIAVLAERVKTDEYPLG